MKTRYKLFAGLSLVFWILSFAFDSTALIATGILFFSYWALIILAIGFLISHVIPVWRKSQYRVKAKYMLIPLSLAAIALISLGFNVLNTPPALLQDASPGEELAYMAQTDQQDRLALIPFFIMPERDINRVNRVLELVDNEALTTAENHYHAALILQHGSTPEHYEMAYLLASEANETGYPNDLWMTAYDRWQISIGNEQVYGTQSSMTFGVGGIQLDAPE